MVVVDYDASQSMVIPAAEAGGEAIVYNPGGEWIAQTK